MLERYLDKSPNAADDLVELAVRSRGQAELVTTPADERVQYWIVGQVEKADVARREAEDLLFVGAPSADDNTAARAAFLQHEKAVWKSAGDAYEDARVLADGIASSYDLRDRGWARRALFCTVVVVRAYSIGRGRRGCVRRS